jgi:hypothetical protein
MGENRNDHRVLWINLKGQDHFKDVGVDRNIILKWVQRNKMGARTGMI